MGRKVHIANYDVKGIQTKKDNGWKETNRFGDLVEMEEPNIIQQKVVNVKQTMLTKLKSGIIKGVFKWKS